MSKRLGLRAILLVCISVLLILLSRLGLIGADELDVIDYALPFAQMANFPAKIVAQTWSNFSSKQQLMAENIRLKAEANLLKAKLHHLAEKSKENALLRELLSSSTQLNGSFVTADLVAIPNDSVFQTFIINRGHESDLYVGQPVVDASGVVGHVAEVGKKSSSVRLVTDPSVAIPVQTEKGHRAIAVGAGLHGLIKLINVQDTTLFHLGDLLVTSGLGLTYPPGYPVGRVVRIHVNHGEGLTEVWLKPEAKINQLHAMLLYWPSK